MFSSYCSKVRGLLEGARPDDDGGDAAAGERPGDGDGGRGGAELASDRHHLVGQLEALVVIAGPSFITVGPEEAELAAAAAGIDGQIAFYASPPAYRPVLDLHGWVICSPSSPG